MANKHQLSSTEIDQVARIAETILSRIADPKPNWRMVADEINGKLGQGSINQESLRLLVRERKAGGRVAAVLREYAKRQGIETMTIITPGTARMTHMPAPSAPTTIVEREERYPIVAHEFSVARATGLVTDAELDVARELVGQFKSDEGPTREQVRQAIAQARREVREAKRFYTEALELDDEVNHG